ncbi:hypothetical protein, partial [Corallococcus interemptor]|uniref:hypothetical protein n=1 Tax=Corallococcus interemptor TaxID=2316720 RepID=UPI001ABF502E
MAQGIKDGLLLLHHALQNLDSLLTFDGGTIKLLGRVSLTLPTALALTLPPRSQFLDVLLLELHLYPYDTGIRKAKKSHFNDYWVYCGSEQLNISSWQNNLEIFPLQGYY